MDARTRQWPSDANYEFISAAAIAAEDTTLLLLLFFALANAEECVFQVVRELHLHLARLGCSASPRIIVLEEIFIVAAIERERPAAFVPLHAVYITSAHNSLYQVN